MMKEIIIGSDHAGFELKEELKQLLAARGLVVTDAGAFCGDSVDYPDFGVPVAEGVSSGRYDRGILVCGSGIGMSIVANRFPGVRAALCADEETARLSRLHNDSNILVLAGRRLSGAEAKIIMDAWLAADFEGGRHARRLDKIRELEKKLCK
ncbi:MAG: ribose 5-phosphate isomerase B [Syntrophales bacterium]|jgi:ribose 5-phosphate isomerase B|nr:ribose 5-phosphate isomerase B [Syntrophales bacterium]MDD5532667.1 ribose 5-phosphate isomerase B [Syntrophales bacterium]